MNSTFKKIIAVLIAAIIAFSVPLTAFSYEEKMSVETSSRCYAGVTYDVVATVNEITEDELIGDEDTVAAFDWSTDNGAPISTTNTYKITENENNTYTVTETAKVTFPDKTGLTVITAKYGKSYIKSIEINTLQPITQITVTPENNETGAYYYESAGETGNDTLYLNSYVKNVDNTAVINFDVLPENNDDAISCGVTNTKYTSVVTSENSTSIKFTALEAPEEDTITVSPMSGYKFVKKIRLVECTPILEYKLLVNNQELTSAVSEYATTIQASISNAIVGDSLVFQPKDIKPASANDSIKYVLYNPDGTLAPNTYYSFDEKGVCTVNASNPGTYKLVSYAVSKGGYFERKLGASVLITFSEANPITSISLYNLNQYGEFDKSSPLDEISLFTITKKTYDLSQNVSILPVGYSHGVRYISDNTAVAKVNEKTGVITAVAGGVANIYVTSEKNSSIVTSCTVRVINELTDLSDISAGIKEIPQGHKVKLTVTKKPANSDERIRWSSANPEALSIDAEGYATANPDYDLQGADKLSILVTATSESGKSTQTFVQISKSIPADRLEAIVESDNATENEDGSYKIFVGSVFNLYALGESKDGVPSNDIYTWYASFNNGEYIDFQTAANNGYFTYKYEESLDIYTITSKLAGKLDLFCIAGKRGQVPSGTTASVTLNVVDKAKSIAFQTGFPTVLATGISNEYTVNMSPLTAYEDDPFMVASSNEAIVKVEKVDYDKILVTTGSNQGTATITLRSLSGGATRSVNITVTNNIAFAQVSGIDAEYEFSGYVIKPVPVVVYNGMKLEEGRDYTLTYSNNTNVGTATIKITGKDNFNASSKEITFNITPKPLESEDITAVVKDTVYATITDANPTPVLTSGFTITDNTRKRTLAVNTDFTVTGVGNDKAGDATIIFTGKGNYTGVITATYKVRDSIAKAEISAIANQKFTGSVITPSFTVTYMGEKLTAGVDYDIRYTNNVYVGKATVTITGKGYFEKTLTANFNIVPKNTTGFKCSSRTASAVTLTWTQDRDATGYQIYDVVKKKIVKTINGNATVTATITGLSPATVYRYKIRTFKTVGGVNYYGNYGSELYTYTAPKTPSLKLKTGSKYITASWSGISGVTGYQIQYSTKSNFSGAKTITLNSKTKSKKFTKLTKGKTYYVRVRSYKKMTVNGKTVTVYSTWSKKSIKCK